MRLKTDRPNADDHVYYAKALCVCMGEQEGERVRGVGITVTNQYVYKGSFCAAELILIRQTSCCTERQCDFSQKKLRRPFNILLTALKKARESDCKVLT